MKQDRSYYRCRYCLMVMIIFMGIFILYSCGGDSDQSSGGNHENSAGSSSNENGEGNSVSAKDENTPRLKPKDVDYSRFVKAVAEELKRDPAFKDSAKLADLKKMVDLHDGILNGFTNTFGMTFKYIRPKVFMMGSPGNEPGRDSDENSHQVTLTKAFMIQTTEVTQGQWKAVLNKAESRGISIGELKKAPSYFKKCGDDCPVESVSWIEVDTWIEILNQLDEGTYSLPSEAQWEYVARGGSDTAFAIGEITETDYTTVDPILNILGWYFGNADGKVHPVAKKKQNLWGLYDMHGNVWEWCLDWYNDYEPDSVTDPVGPDKGTYRVLRGGGWVDSAAECRSANRFRGDPSTRGSGVGFRLIRGVMTKGRIAE